MKTLLTIGLLLILAGAGCSPTTPASTDSQEASPTPAQDSTFEESERERNDIYSLESPSETGLVVKATTPVEIRGTITPADGVQADVDGYAFELQSPSSLRATLSWDSSVQTAHSMALMKGEGTKRELVSGVVIGNSGELILSTEVLEPGQYSFAISADRTIGDPSYSYRVQLSNDTIERCVVADASNSYSEVEVGGIETNGIVTLLSGHAAALLSIAPTEGVAEVSGMVVSGSQQSVLHGTFGPRTSGSGLYLDHDVFSFRVGENTTQVRLHAKATNADADVALMPAHQIETVLAASMGVGTEEESLVADVKPGGSYWLWIGQRHYGDGESFTPEVYQIDVCGVDNGS